jgi:hypothetical protein
MDLNGAQIIVTQTETNTDRDVQRKFVNNFAASVVKTQKLNLQHSQFTLRAILLLTAGGTSLLAMQR